MFMCHNHINFAISKKCNGLHTIRICNAVTDRFMTKKPDYLSSGDEISPSAWTSNGGCAGDSVPLERIRGKIRSSRKNIYGSAMNITKEGRRENQRLMGG